jgi:hypothetical protein
MKDLLLRLRKTADEARPPHAYFGALGGISDAIFYKWRSKYGGIEVSDARRPKALESENGRGRVG